MSFIYDMSDSWNNAGTTFTAIKMNVTDTASAVGSKVMDLQIGGTSQFIVDKFGNVGVGATPSAWQVAGGRRAIEVGSTGCGIYGFSQTNMLITSGTYYNGSNFIATATGGVTYSQQIGGEHRFYNGTGTAGNAVTFTQAMTLTNAGNLGLGTTSPVAYSGYTVLDIDNATSGGLINIKKAGTTVGYINGSAGMLVLSNLAPLSLTTVGAYALQFQTNSTERMRIDGSGNVGIGATPSAWDTFKVLQVGHGAIAAPTFSNTIVTANCYYGSGSQRYLASSAPASLFQQADGVFYWRTAPSGTAGNAITFTEAMRLDASGNLGLGTAPSAWASSVNALETTTGAFYSYKSGSTSVFYMMSNAYFNGTNNIYKTSAAATQYAHFGGAHQWFNAPAGTAGNAITFTQAMTLDASGNLGLGVTPGSNDYTGVLQTKWVGHGITPRGVTNISYNMNANHTGGGWKYGNNGAAAVYIQSDAGHSWSYAASGTAGNAITFTQAMTLDASGNLGIGTTSPLERLHLNSASAVQVATRYVNSNTTSVTVGAAADGSAFVYQAAAKPFIVYTNAAERMRVDSAGTVLVGTTSTDAFNPGVRIYPTRIVASHTSATASDDLLYINRQSSEGTSVRFAQANTVVGSISVTSSATAYNTSSDYRLKDIDGPIVNSGAYIDALRPVQGSWKADGSRFIGLLAHEVQEVSETQIATGEKDGEEMQAMDYSAPEIIANLIAEVQSLRARVAEIERN